MTAGPANSVSAPQTDPTREVRTRFRVNLAWTASLFLTGLGAKLWLIRNFGSSLPFWDEWPREGIDLFVPWFQHQLTVAALFTATSEHRIVFTRLCELGLMLLNGQWDSMVEMVFNAFLHAAAIAALGCLFATLLGRRSWPLVWVVLVLDLAVPFAWENTLWGYQSQFYFLCILSVLAIWLLGSSRPPSPRWCFGVAAAVAALFTMGSGLMAAAVAGAFAFLDWLRDRAPRRLLTVGVCAAVVIAGWLMMPPKSADDAYLSRTAADFLTALGRNLAWPWVIQPLYALFNIFPLAALAWISFRSREAIGAAERLLLGIGFWVVLQCLALARYRGAGGAVPAWRYMDPLSLLAVANALALFLLLTHHRARLHHVLLWRAASVLWAVGCMAGLWFLANLAFEVYIPQHTRLQNLRLATCRTFIVNDNANWLRHQDPDTLIVPNPEAAIWLLRNPDLRRVFPTCLLETGGVNTAPETAAALEEPREPGPLSRWALCAARTWQWWLTGGIACLLLGFRANRSAPSVAGH